MKKTDIAMIILIASLSIIAAFFATNALMGEAATEEELVDTAKVITSDITPPDPKIFNENAINPTVEVQVGESSQ